MIITKWRENGEVSEREIQEEAIMGDYALHKNPNYSEGNKDVISPWVITHIPTGWRIMHGQETEMRYALERWKDTPCKESNPDKARDMLKAAYSIIMGELRRGISTSQIKSRVKARNDNVIKRKKQGPKNEYQERTARLIEGVDLKSLTIAGLARIIGQDWKDKKGNPCVWFGAKPYLSAMFSMEKITDKYGMDDGESIIAYFLCNANTWRGPVAREIKKELNRRLKV